MNLKRSLNTILITLPIIASTEVFAQEKQTSGINLSYMDRTVDPADDFFRFVNGSWYDKTEIPADRTRWGSFDELRQNTDSDALQILKEAAENPKYISSTDQGKAVNLYRSIMDTIARNKQGINPLKPHLAKINAVKNIKDLQALLIETEPFGGAGFFGAGVGPDSKNSNRNLVNI